MNKVCEIVRKQLALPPEADLTAESKFSALGADSLDTVLSGYLLVQYQHMLHNIDLLDSPSND